MLGKRCLHAVEFDVERWAPIARLLLDRGPTAIPRLIAAIVVDALDRHARRALPHIGEEGVEALPALAHGDAAARVGREAVMARLSASGSHADPRLPRARLRHTVRPVHGCR